MKSVNPLADKIAAYILSQEAPVSMTALFARAQGRFRDKDVSDALSYIHRHRKDIKVTVRDDDNQYSKKTVKPATPAADNSEWNTYCNSLRTAWYDEQERLRTADPIEYTRIEDILDGVGEYVEMKGPAGRTWLIPRGSEEHYQKLIHGKTNTKRKV